MNIGRRRHRIRVVGDSDRAADRQHRRPASDLPARSADLPVLAQGRDRRAGCTIRAGGHRQTRRHQPGPDSAGHDDRGHHHHPGCPRIRVVGQARLTTGDRHLDLWGVRHHRGQRRNPGPQFRRQLCHRGDPGAGRGGAVTLPPLGHAIGLSDYEFGLWAGLSVDNTAETTATGYLFSDHAGKIAVLVKSTRNALIGFVVLGFAVFWASRGEADEIAPGFRAKAAFVWAKFPKFVLGFLAVSAIATAHWLSKGQTANLANVSKWAFLLTFAGVGLTTDIRQIARTGWRPLVVAIIGLTVVASVSLGLVLLTSRVFHWGWGT